MLSIYLTQKLEAKSGNDVIYHFCNSEDEKRNRSTAVFRTLIWQIVTKQPALAQLVTPYFNLAERVGAALASPGFLWRILLRLIQDASLRTTYCIIDAQDGCEDGSTRWLASQFAELHEETPRGRMHVLIVSRELPELSGVKRNSLELKDRQPRWQRRGNVHVGEDAHAVTEASTLRGVQHLHPSRAPATSRRHFPLDRSCYDRAVHTEDQR